MIHRMVKPLKSELSKSVPREMEILGGGRRLISLQVLCVICLACFSTSRTQQGPKGFISIDCGSDVSYYDNDTGIYWETDDKYTMTGSNYKIAVVTSNETYTNPIINKRQSGTARVFSDPRKRSCYVLPVVTGETYLLRTTFFLGNLTDGVAMPEPISFYAWIDNNWINQYVWHSGGSNLYKSVSDEVIYSAKRSTLSFCLVWDDQPVIFISALELRLLSTSMYSTVLLPARNQDNPQYLYLVDRYNCGPDETSSVTIWRHPDDAYDRIWKIPSLPTDNLTSISNGSISLPLNSIVQDPDQAPLSVMEDAVVKHGSLSIVFPIDHFGVEVAQVYAAAYFQELDGNASGANVRGMHYFVNDNLTRSFNITDEPLEIYLARGVQEVSLNISLSKAAWSSSDPILNAIEVYTTWPFDTGATAAEDVSAILALQNYFNLTDWTGDPCLPVPFDWLGCNNDGVSLRITTLNLADRGFEENIPLDILNLTAMTDLLLNNNSFNGSIPDFSDLVHLQTILLQDNSLTGEIPSFLGSAFPNLTHLNLDHNSLSGPLPSDLVAPGFNFTYSNNAGLFTPTLRKTSIAAVVGGTLGGVAALAIVSTIMYMLFTRKRRARAKILKALEFAENSSSGIEFSKLRKALQGSMISLTLQEISNATKKFSKKIGEGSYGPVFYGMLPDGREVAVKMKSTDSHQGATEFFNEVDLLSRIHHRNLVSLVGFCEDGKQQILIYAYLSNGNLGDVLYGDKSSNGLDWLTRLDIALNAARGLEYLHTDCQPRIIHRDVKSSNILLDENMVAKVADFGISKQAPDGKFTVVDTLLKGTFGYMDPEYFTSLRLTQKSDVYSFGVVLLEIISGRNPFIAELPDGTSGTLIQWVRSAVNYGSPMDTVDPSLKGEFNEDAMTKVVSLAISCIDPQTARRPDMGQVVRTLIEAIELEPFSRATFNMDCATNGSIVCRKDEAQEISQDDRDFSFPEADETTFLSPR